MPHIEKKRAGRATRDAVDYVMAMAHYTAGLEKATKDFDAVFGKTARELLAEIVANNRVESATTLKVLLDTWLLLHDPETRTKEIG